MIKKYYALMILLVLFAVSPFCLSSAERFQKSTYIFPVSLEEIEEEAFENTAGKTLVFSDKLFRIGDNAFGGNNYLADVYAPLTLEHISDSAFTITSELVIHGPDDSYAKKWAEEHQVPYSTENTWNIAILEARQLFTQRVLIDNHGISIYPEIKSAMHETGENEVKRKRPQDRPEMNPLDYKFP